MLLLRLPQFLETVQDFCYMYCYIQSFSFYVGVTNDKLKPLFRFPSYDE